MERNWQDADYGDGYDTGPPTPSDQAYPDNEDGWREPAGANLRESFRSTRGNDNFKGDQLLQCGSFAPAAVSILRLETLVA